MKPGSADTRTKDVNDKIRVLGERNNRPPYQTSGEALYRQWDGYIKQLVNKLNKRYRLPTDYLDDAVQEVYLRTLLYLPRFRFQCRFQTLLFYVSRSAISDLWYFYRKTSEVITFTGCLEEMESILSPHSVDVVKSMDETDTILRIAKSFVNSLSEKERAIWNMRFESGLSGRQIAEAAGIPLGSVYVTLQRTTEKVRRYLLEEKMSSCM